jgi:hypothetical protein
MRVTDIYQLDREYQQLRADFILGKIHSVEIVRQSTAVAALLTTPKTVSKAQVKATLTKTGD